jgi:type I restriction enzyme, R subunit
VLKLEADSAANGAGHSYLVQHSAGSGKSNTIAWTAHRLSTLHDAQDRKVFDKVVVITDRVILDRQLQDTIYQFEHARGLVVKIDKDSGQLAEALSGEQARIIITTPQKFPFVLDKIGTLPARNYAVVIDEAHSSQTGEAAKDLRLALGAGEEQELTATEAEDAGLLASAIDPVEEALAKSVGARSERQPNLSYFAFTATPKGRTLEMFGRLNPETKVYEPFHLYSMRQAIEEGFIMDVLANYTTYQTFWKIEKATEQDPEYDARKARRAIARFVSLHPYHLAQKAEITGKRARIIQSCARSAASSWLSGSSLCRPP